MIKKYSELKLASRLTIYRGETQSSENRGKGGIGYWTTDPEFARQFTQSGQIKELLKKDINPDFLYDARKEGLNLPSANSESDFDRGMQIAKEKGFLGFVLEEGSGDPESFYIFDKGIFRK